MKKFSLLICPLVVLILELLPFGAVLNFANPEGESFRETFSYFSLTPFGYANFGPFITAVLSCILLISVIIYVLKGKLKKFSIILGIVACAVSLSPLLFGLHYYSVIAGLITFFLGLEVMLIDWVEMR